MAGGGGHMEANIDGGILFLRWAYAQAVLLA